MRFFSEDLEPMVELYQRETAELMKEFDLRQTCAMQENRLSEQDINAVFRVVHTIKSSAAMMGLKEISDATHRMEDLFLLFRDRPERAVGHENRLFDLMYRFSDYVETENERVVQKEFQPTDADGLIEAIAAEIDFFGAESVPDEAPQTAQTAQEAQETQPEQAEPEKSEAAPGELVWRVVLQPNCQMENVRAFLLVRQLRALCTKLTTIPADLESPDAAALIGKNGLSLTFRTAREDEASRLLSSSPYVLRVEKDGPKTAAAKSAARDELSPTQNKFSTVAWEQVVSLQNVTGDLITASTMLGEAVKSGGGALDNAYQTLKRLLQELEKVVSAVSMMPVSSAAPQYYRLVRDIAAQEKKQIRMNVVGGDLEVDRNLLDTLAKPIQHLLRNAADHGIESPEQRAAAGKDPVGVVTLKFENLSDHLLVTVTDDGGGMDKDRILRKAADRGLLTKAESEYSDQEILNLIFAPGLTTNDQANQFSGRGVGMDVALSVVGSLGGSVTVSSEPGRRSSVVMEVPVSVTSSECVRFAVGPYACLIPIRCVVHIYSFREAENRVQTIDGRMWLQTEELLPVLDLFSLYGIGQGDERRLIVIRDTKGAAALLTGPVTGQQTAVEKTLPAILGRGYRRRTGIIGCTVIETGGLGVMLSADWLIEMCGKEKANDGK